jgi:hypothetical protein
MRMWIRFLVILWSQRIWSSEENIFSRAALRSDEGPAVVSGRQPNEICNSGR